MEMKHTVFLPFELLPEGKDWSIGKNYRVKVVLKQVSTNEEGATFEVVDASSLDLNDIRMRRIATDGGYIRK